MNIKNIFILSFIFYAINTIAVIAADPTFYFASEKTKYEIKKTTGDTLPLTVKLSQNTNRDIKVDLEITGGKSQLEDYGTGKNFTVSNGAVTLLGYEKTRVTLNFPAGITSQTAIVSFFNNPVIDLDRIINVRLVNPSNGVKIAPDDNIAIKIIDDQRIERIDVKNPGHGLKAMMGDGITDESDKLQKIFNYIMNHGNRHVVYFPAGTYVLRRVKPSWGISLVGAGINQTVIKKLDALKIGRISISATDPAVITLPAGHGLKNGNVYIVFLADGTASGEGLELMQQAYRVKNLIGNTCNLEYTGTHPKRGTLLNASNYKGKILPPFELRLQHSEHTFDSLAYNGTGDSLPLVFRDMTIDGNSSGIGPWKYYEAEHAYPIFTCARGAGYIKTIVENVHFKDMVAAAIHPFSKSDYNIYKITMKNGSAGGVCAVSGRDVKVKAVDISATHDRPDEEPEFHSENAYNVNIFVRNLNITGSLVLGVQANSTVEVENATVGRAVVLFAKDSVQRCKNLICDTKIEGGGFASQAHAWAADNGSITFEKCKFYANGKGAKGGDVLTAAPQVGFSLGKQVNNGSVTFKNCIFACRNNIPSGCIVYGIYQATLETAASNNNLVIDNCRIDGINRIFEYGFYMNSNGGGRINIKDTFINALCAISLSAQHNSTSDNQLAANLENLTFGDKTTKLYCLRINNAIMPAAIINHVNMTIPESKNIIHTYWPINPNWNFNGNRIILGDGNGPTSLTNGLIGDIYKDQSGRYICKAPAYYDERDKKAIAGAWTLQGK